MTVRLQNEDLLNGAQLGVELEQRGFVHIQRDCDGSCSAQLGGRGSTTLRKMDALSTSCVGMFGEMFSIHYGPWLSLGVLWVFDVEMDQDIYRYSWGINILFANYNLSSLVW